MNSIHILGRMTGDPELKTTNNGVSVTGFTVVVDRSYTPKGQEKQADFIPCVAWRQTAEFITRYFRKGNRIALQGALQSRKYTGRDGNNRTVYEVVVDRVFFCESGADKNVSRTIDRAIDMAVDEILTDEELPF